MFKSGQKFAGCTTPATIAPVSHAPRVAWVIRSHIAVGVVVLCPTAKTAARLRANLPQAVTWSRVRPVTLASGASAYIVRVGIRSGAAAKNPTVPTLRALAPVLSSVALGVL